MRLCGCKHSGISHHGRIYVLVCVLDLVRNSIKSISEHYFVSGKLPLLLNICLALSL
uniref:Uncharacterized protein n=1 Tax=Arundo donax TaxID=35708 RepID=A0A0A8YNV7_ARUDO